MFGGEDFTGNRLFTTRKQRTKQEVRTFLVLLYSIAINLHVN